MPRDDALRRTRLVFLAAAAVLVASAAVSTGMVLAERCFCEPP